ncbi:MAG: nuclear transport factor 2 family protein [Acidimicrobiales bacterium]
MAADLSVTSELAAIEATLQTYFDGLYDGDVDKLAEAFHPVAHLYSVSSEAEVADLPLAEWLRIVAGRASARARGDARLDRVVTIDQSGPATAFAKVQCQLPPRYFTDYLSLLKVEGRWRIVSKSFHTDTREA